MIAIYRWFCFAVLAGGGGVIGGSCGNYGFFWPGVTPFRAWGGAYGLRPKSRAWRVYPPRLWSGSTENNAITMI